MECKKCGKEISDESVFCSFCGKKQTVEVPRRKTKSRGNGQGSVYKLPDDKWGVEITRGYKIENGKKTRVIKRKKGFKTKKEALDYLPTLRNNSTKPKDIKFSQLYDEWINSLQYSKKSKGKQAAYKIAYKKCGDLHYKNILDIRTPDIQAVVDSVKGKYYPKHDVKVLCSLLFKFAVKQNYLTDTKNYASFVDLPTAPKSKNVSFTDDEIAAFWKDYESGNDFTGYILIMIYTGMRYGEMTTIKKANVHLEKNYMIGGIKTDAGINREIAINEKIKPIVEKCYYRGKRKLMEISEKNFYARYYETLKRNGIPETKKPHCCKHTFASLSARAGTHPAIIREMAGHEDYSTTLQYTHIPLSDKIEAANKI